MPPVIDKNNCKKCGVCVEICSEDVFFGSTKGNYPVVAYPEACWYCNSCVKSCQFEGAIKLRIPLNLMIAHK